MDSSVVQVTVQWGVLFVLSSRLVESVSEVLVKRWWYKIVLNYPCQEYGN